MEATEPDGCPIQAQARGSASQGTPRRSQLHAAWLVALTAVVFWPAGHAVQSGLGKVALPPGEKKPKPHVAQVAPPAPGAHTVTATDSGMGGDRVCLERPRHAAECWA